MRDGAAIDTRPVAELDEDTLVRLMVGRDVSNLYPKPEVEIGETRLRVERVTRHGILEDCSFEVRAGEILGFAGLIGAGRTELARAVFGAEKMDSGSVELDGETLRIRSPKDAIRAGITYLTESRKTDGLALQLGIDKNITLAQLPMKAGFISLGRENTRANAHKEQLNIRTPSVQRQVQLLSGGNQQKVLVGRWLETPSKVMFFDEPGRGVDVGAKAEMFELIGKLAQDGKAIVLISSYLPELMNMCDRILVMREGKVAGEVTREEFSEERIVSLATGAGEEAA
jgi:ABC-type sugar transport system ATPase subunit